jgi:PPOX class probable F420-dependent enzyme
VTARATGAALQALPGWARSLLEDERVGHLGVLDGDARPRVLPVTYAIHGGAAWSAIDNKPKRSGREPARIGWLRERPQATLTVDRYDEDWSRLRWVQLLGSVAVLDGPPPGPVLDALVHRYPQYREDPPPGPTLRLVAERAVCWRAA